MRTPCADCGRPEATQNDWDTIPEGEGAHLCWGRSDGVCASMKADTAASLRAQLAAANERAERAEAVANEQARQKVEQIVIAHGLREALAKAVEALEAVLRNTPKHDATAGDWAETWRWSISTTRTALAEIRALIGAKGRS